jgi:hypothetical protein
MLSVIAHDFDSVGKAIVSVRRYLFLRRRGGLRKARGAGLAGLAAGALHPGLISALVAMPL